jgi:hypothetical protein
MTIKPLTSGVVLGVLLLAGGAGALEHAVLETRILLFDETMQRTRPADERQTFYDGQRFRLNVRSAQDGYLYALCLTSQGTVKLLHPSDSSDNHLQSGRSATFPQTGWFRFDQEPGTEDLYLILSGRKIAELDQAAEDGTDLSRAVLHRYISSPPRQGGASASGIDVVAGPSRTVQHIGLRHEPRE